MYIEVEGGVTEGYPLLMNALKEHSIIEESQRGRVHTIPEPVTVSFSNPTRRVLLHSVRQPNPYFHVLETAWMLAGLNGARHIAPYNNNIRKSAEEDGSIHGAYGHRWRTHFGLDQVDTAIQMLKYDPTTRHAVISLWDARTDLTPLRLNDRPCNTQIMFRIVHGCLDMTVVNRSNDVVWGLLGANYVHMTYLQEVVARAIKVPLGNYRVMANNLHIYQHHWELLENLDRNLSTPNTPTLGAYPILFSEETYPQLTAACEAFFAGTTGHSCAWVDDVVAPMAMIYKARKAGIPAEHYRAVKCPAWREACEHWHKWKEVK